MTVLAIGDSNVLPGRAGNLKNCAHQFARNINHGDKAHCWAKGGASNHWIMENLNQILNNIDAYPDPVFFIGWTQWEREEWEWGDQEFSVCIGPHFPVAPELEERYKNWRDSMTDAVIQEKRDAWHEIIYIVHQRLDEMDIPHCFWTTYDNFIGYTGVRQYDWSGSFFRPYDHHGCMKDWFAENNIDPIPGDPWHWDGDSSSKWGDVLASHFLKN